MGMLNERQKAACGKGLSVAADQLVRVEYLDKIAAGMPDMPELQEIADRVRAKRDALARICQLHLDTDATLSQE